MPYSEFPVEANLVLTDINFGDYSVALEDDGVYRDAPDQRGCGAVAHGWHAAFWQAEPGMSAGTATVRVVARDREGAAR